MTTPVGRAQHFVTHASDFPVLGAPASIIGSELPQSPLGAPTLRFAPSRFPKPSLTLAPAIVAHNTLRYGHPPSGAPDLSGAGLCGIPCGVPALYSKISLEAPAGSGSPIPPTGVLIMYSLGVRRGALYIR